MCAFYENSFLRNNENLYCTDEREIERRLIERSRPLVAKCSDNNRDASPRRERPRVLRTLPREGESVNELPEGRAGLATQSPRLDLEGEGVAYAPGQRVSFRRSSTQKYTGDT